MNKFVVDYEYGVADFWTDSDDPKKVLSEFHTMASTCFGIRKSLGECRIVQGYPRADLPLPFRGHDATHCLTHHGDEILFDDRYQTHDGEPWKLHDFGNWCSCAQRGVAELSCSVHHFWVPNHDAVCARHRKV